jgi:hypothetical protein
MGKLRKIGRKIKKKVKKLFSTKLGKIVGMIGTMYAMSFAMNSIKGFFTKGATEGAASSTLASTGEAVGTKVSTATPTGGFTPSSSNLIDGGSTQTLGNVVETAPTNIQAAETVVKGTKGIAANGSTLPSTDISGAVESTAEVFDATTVAEANDGLNFLNETKGNIMDVNTSQFTPPEVGAIDTSAATELMNTGPEIAFQGSDIAAGPPVESVTQSTEALVGDSKLKNLAINTKEGVSNLGEKIGTYFKEGDVIPDTIAGVGTGLVMSKLQDEPEMGGGFMAPQPVQVQAQGAYMQEVGPVMSNITGVPNFNNFAQMAQQNIYGIGTPNHLAGLYG